MPTIKDVAKQAGVSVATVSNIINHKSCVSNEKYEKVMKVIEELNYTPSFLASNLKNNKAKLMAIIVPELNIFYGQIIKGVQQFFEKENRSVVVKCSNYSAYQEASMLTDLVEVGVRGVIIAYSAMKNIEQYEAIQALSIPIVFLCSKSENYDYSSVTFTNASIIYETTLSIAKNKEYNRIMLITCSKDYSDEQECINGFEMAVEKAGLQGEHCVVRNTRELSYIDLMEVLPGNQNLPETFIVSNQNVAESLRDVLMAMGKRIDIYFLSGDATYDYCEQQLICINRSAIKMGQTGARLIEDYNKSPLYSESSNVKIEQTDYVYENLNWKKYRKKKIRVLALEGQQSKALRKLASFFKNEYGIEVECTCLGYTELYDRIIEENNKCRSDFDVFMLDYQQFASILNEKYLLNIREYLDNDGDNFISGFLPIAKKEFIEYSSEGIYNIPLLTTMQLLFYRRDLFEDKSLQWHFFKKHGVDLRPPRTWSEFDIIAQYFTRSINPESPVKYGVSMGDFSPISICEQFFPRQWAYRGSLVSNGKVSFDNLKNKKALSSMLQSFLCSEPVASYTTENLNSILNGDTAMCMTYATHVPCTKVDVNYRVDYSDILATRVPGNCPMLGGWSLGINSFSKMPFESYMFIKWLTSNKNMAKNTLLGGFVPKNISKDNVQINFVYPWVKDLLKNFNNAKRRNDIKTIKGEHIERVQIDAILAEGITEIFKGSKTMAEVSEMLENNLNKIINR